MRGMKREGRCIEKRMWLETVNFCQLSGCVCVCVCALTENSDDSQGRGEDPIISAHYTAPDQHLPVLCVQWSEPHRVVTIEQPDSIIQPGPPHVDNSVQHPHHTAVLERGATVQEDISTGQYGHVSRGLSPPRTAALQGEHLGHTLSLSLSLSLLQCRLLSDWRVR